MSLGIPTSIPPRLVLKYMNFFTFFGFCTTAFQNGCGRLKIIISTLLSICTPRRNRWTGCRGVVVVVVVMVGSSAQFGNDDKYIGMCGQTHINLALTCNGLNGYDCACYSRLGLWPSSMRQQQLQSM